MGSNYDIAFDLTAEIGKLINRRDYQSVAHRCEDIINMPSEDFGGEQMKAFTYGQLGNILERRVIDVPLEDTSFGSLAKQLYEAAVEAYDKAYAESQDSNLLNSKGMTLIRLNRREEAIVALEKAIAVEEDPRALEIYWRNLSNIYVELGKFDKGVECYAKSEEFQKQRMAKRT